MTQNVSVRLISNLQNQNRVKSQVKPNVRRHQTFFYSHGQDQSLEWSKINFSTRRVFKNASKSFFGSFQSLFRKQYFHFFGKNFGSCKNSERNFENDSKHDQKFDFDQTLSIREVDSPKKIQWDSKNRRIYWLNQDGKIYSSLENGDNLTELDLDGDYARGFDIYSVGNIIYWSNAKKNQIYLTKLTPDGSGEQLGSLKTDNIYPEEIAISSSSGFLFFTNNCGPRYTSGDECRLIFRSKMNGEKLCSVLHGTPKVTSLVAHQSPKSRNLVELYWNDSNKIRQISVDITVNTEVCNKPGKDL